MTLQTLLTNACRDAKIVNPELYTLKENRKELDLTLPFRFTNLSPGAKLTLVKSTKPVKKTSKVMIALQMPEGGRLNDEFLTSITLWDILLHFEKRSRGALNLTKKVEKESSPKNTLKKLIKSDKYVYVQPVCIVLNKEYGTIEDLKKTTLKSAGINEDVMIRMLFKFTDKSLNEMLPLIEADMSNTNAEMIENENKKIKIEKPNQPTIQQPTQPPVQQPIQQPVQSPVQSPVQQPSFQQPIQLPVQQSVQQSDKQLVQQSDQPPVQPLVQQPSFQQPIQSQVQPSVQQPIQPTIQPSAQQQNNDVDVVMSSDDLPDNNDMDVDEKINESINRDIKFYNPPKDNSTQYNRIDLPDSFFELSQFEMKILISQQTKKQKELENMPLKTRAMREQEDEQKRKKYPKCLIRIKFPNRTMAEMTFLSNELVSDLYKEVEAILYTKEKPFYLYTTPPKAILSDQSQSLWKAGLVPSSNVYFNWSNEKDKDTVKKFLAPKCESQLKDLVIENVPITVPTQNNRNYSGPGYSLSSSSSSNKPQSNISRLNSDNSNDYDKKKSSKMKMPKWFKLQ